jgi:type IV secretory pathway TrbF-like protein
MNFLTNSKAPRMPHERLETPPLGDKVLHEISLEASARRHTIKNYLIAGLMLYLGYTIYTLGKTAQDKQYIPFAVAVTDDASVRGVADMAPNWRPDEVFMQRVVHRFILATRGRFLDPWIRNYLWQEAGVHTKGEGRAAFSKMFFAANPAAYKGTIEVKIKSSLPLDLLHYEVHWTEIEREENGQLKTDDHGEVKRPISYRGLFTLSVAVPQKIEERKDNPFGVWVYPWTISTEEQ